MAAETSSASARLTSTDALIGAGAGAGMPGCTPQSYNSATMTELVPATGRVLEEILDDTFVIWSDGLTRANYARYNDGQMRTPWGRRSLDRVALVEHGAVQSSLKRYRFNAHLDGRAISVLGLGAVFTQPSARNRGAAARLIEAVLADAGAAGTECALLFSEIGAGYYKRLGFVEIPRDEVMLETIDKAGAPAILVRAGDERDIPVVTSLLESMTANGRFALDVDEDFVRYSLSKKRLLAGLSPAGSRAVEFFVAEEGASAVAFVLLTHGATGAILEACGDRDPSGARVGAILQVLRAREPARDATAIRTWLPPGFLPPQLRIVSRRPAPEIMMLKPLVPHVRVDSLRADDVVFWHGDVF